MDNAETTATATGVSEAILAEMHSVKALILRATALAAFGMSVLIPSVAQASVSSASGQSLLNASKSAVSREHSVHVVSISSSIGLGASPDVSASVTIITDAAQSEGVQHMTFQQGGTTGQETTEEVGGVGYLRGDAFTLQNFNGFSAAAAAKYASVWLKVTKSDSAFAKVTAGLTMSSMPAQIMLPRPQLLGVTTFRGSSVKELRAVVTEPSGTVTGLLYVRSRGVPLPVEQMFTQGNGGGGSDVFSDWNEPVTITAPTSSVPLSSTGQ